MSHKIRTATRRAVQPAKAALTAPTDPSDSTARGQGLIDLENDQLYPVAAEFERTTGHAVSKCTIHRAIQGKGAGGIALEAVFIHGEWVTTRRAMADYIARTTAAHRERNARALLTRRARAAIATRARADRAETETGGAE